MSDSLKQLKKMAFGFFGVSYFESYLHWSNRKKDIDFRFSYDNYKTMLFDYFSKEYEIDTFISTYKHQFINQLLNMYNPKNHFLANFPSPPRTKGFIDYSSKNAMMIKALDLIVHHSHKYNITYDHVCLTRFDLIWIKKFEDCKNPINYSAMNNMSILEKPNIFDDNWFLFPYEFTNKLRSLLKEKIHHNTHQLFMYFSKHFGKINFLNSDFTKADRLSTFRIQNRWVK